MSEVWFDGRESNLQNSSIIDEIVMSQKIEPVLDHQCIGSRGEGEERTFQTCFTFRVTNGYEFLFIWKSYKLKYYWFVETLIYCKTFFL